MDLTVSRSALEAMLSHARSALPRECCGILLGCGERIERVAPAANVHPEPARRFEIDPQALVDAHRAERAGGPQVLGWYHSHPAGPAAPSVVDRAGSLRDGRVWAILGPDGVTFWRDSEQGFAPLSYRLVDG